MRQTLAPALLIFAVALAFRAPRLADRPTMHADEAVLADKFGTLLEKGSYQYDPREFHGPLLAWLTLLQPSEWRSSLPGARGSNSARRAGSVWPPPGPCPTVVTWRPGQTGSFAAGLTAISPAMVYYSRYYIPEMLFDGADVRRHRLWLPIWPYP